MRLSKFITRMFCMFRSYWTQRGYVQIENPSDGEYRKGYCPQFLFTWSPPKLSNRRSEIGDPEKIWSFRSFSTYPRHLFEMLHWLSISLIPQFLTQLNFSCDPNSGDVHFGGVRTFQPIWWKAYSHWRINQMAHGSLGQRESFFYWLTFHVLI